MRKIILFIVVMICSATYSCVEAQIENSFFSMKKRYEFTLPQFGLSIPLPAKAGFQTPQIQDEKTMLEINRKTTYCVDLEKLDKDKSTVQLAFSVSGAEKHLNLLIYKMTTDAFERKKKKLNEQTAYEQIPTLKTKLGKETFSISNGKTDYHYLHRNGYAFCFFLESETPKKIKKQYSKIIRKVHAKDLEKERLEYEAQVASGYFDKKTDEKDRLFSVWEGKTSRQTTFAWDIFNMQVTIPEGWQYRANANQLVKTDHEANIRLAMDSLDFRYNSMMVTWFSSDSLSLIVRSYTKDANVNVMKTIRESASYVSYSAKKTISIDGIAMPATLYGTQELADIDIYYEAGGISHWLSLSGITTQTLPLADEILLSIKINQPQLKNKPLGDCCSTLSQCFKMKEAAPVRLDNPLDIPYLDESKTIVCSLPNIGMQLRIPGPESQWHCSVGGERTAMINGVIKAAPINNYDKRLAIYSQPEGVNYNISRLPDNSPMDIKAYTEKFKRGFSAYKNITILHAGVTVVNNKPWSICIYKQDKVYIGAFTSANEKYEMSIVAGGSSYEEIVEKAGYIRMVEF